MLCTKCGKMFEGNHCPECGKTYEVMPAVRAGHIDSRSTANQAAAEVAVRTMDVTSDHAGIGRGTRAVLIGAAIFAAGMIASAAFIQLLGLL